MDIFSIIDTLTGYGADIAFISVMTCAVVQILKRTVLRNCQKKVLTFLPFLLGTIFYAAFTAAYSLSIAPLVDGLPEVCERGFTIGSLSTVIYVWYEQFVRAKDTKSATEGVIATLIEGYVPTDEVESVAKNIAEAISRDVSGEGAKRTAEILTANTGEGTSERDIALLSKLIIETLAHLNGAAAK